MSVNKSYKRKLSNIFINPKYQMRYIFWLTGTGFTLVFANTLVFYWYVKENYQFLVEMSPMTDEAKAQLFKELSNILVILSLTSALFLLFVAFVGLIYSHRTAGPLYHFQRVFQEIKNGNRSARIRLRPNDDFKEVANTFNEMMDKIV